jgi:hypothetical protein
MFPVVRVYVTQNGGSMNRTGRSELDKVGPF